MSATTINLPADARVFTWSDCGGDYMLTVWNIHDGGCLVSMYGDEAYGPTRYEEVEATPAAYAYIRNEWSTSSGHGGCHISDAVAGCGPLTYADSGEPVADHAYLIAFDGHVYAESA